MQTVAKDCRNCLQTNYINREETYMKKVIALLLSLTMVVGMLTACGAKEEAPAEAPAATEEAAEEAAPAADGAVYYLNFKPEQDEAWQNLAKAYTEETGVPVTVVTAASGEYETTLMAEMGKSEAPTLFQVNGPVGLANWKDYCYDLAGSDIYGQLTSDSFALKEGDAVYGIAYVIESYGIIANKTLLAEAGHDVAEIDSFEDLKAVAEDITARKDELGFAAFSSAGMDGSSDWRFKTHLANLPIYFEYQADGIGTTDAIKGTYLDNYRAIWDLYINNSTCAPAELSAKTGDDSRNDFLEGKAVFFQNGSWEYGSLAEKYTDDQLTMLPIYIGVGDEANQGLCTGTENYWCVNGTASEAVESPNHFVKVDNELTAAGKTPVAWNFPTMPSEEWKNGVGSALTAYAADQTDANWDAVVAAFVDGWAAEAALN